MKSKEEIRKEWKEAVKLERLYRTRKDKRMCSWFRARKMALKWVLKYSL